MSLNGISILCFAVLLWANATRAADEYAGSTPLSRRRRLSPLSPANTGAGNLRPGRVRGACALLTRPVSTARSAAAPGRRWALPGALRMPTFWARLGVPVRPLVRAGSRGCARRRASSMPLALSGSRSLRHE